MCKGVLRQLQLFEECTPSLATPCVAFPIGIFWRDTNNFAYPKHLARDALNVSR